MKQMIINKFNKVLKLLVNNFILQRYVNWKQSFIFSFILSNLDIEVSETSTKLVQLSYGVFLLSLISLLSIINIIGYIISYILIQENKDKIVLKYPRINKIINYYKKSSLLFLSIEIVICLLCLILLCSFSLIYIYISR